MTSTLNADGQPYAVGFNRGRNIDKATYVLNRIIGGVESDGWRYKRLSKSVFYKR